MKKLSLAAALTFALGSIWIARAHHSFAAEFDASKSIRIEGVLTKIEWTNPHAYF
jgi:hypothetical protein